MGDRTDLTVFFATQTVPRGEKGRNPLKYIIIRTKYFVFRGSFCRVLIHRSKADGNSFPGSICLTCFSPSFVQHPVLLYCIYTPKTHRKVLAMECTPTFVDLGLMELLKSYFSVDFSRIHCLLSLKGMLQEDFNPF